MTACRSFSVSWSSISAPPLPSDLMIWSTFMYQVNSNSPALQERLCTYPRNSADNFRGCNWPLHNHGRGCPFFRVSVSVSSRKIARLKASGSCPVRSIPVSPSRTTSFTPPTFTATLGTDCIPASRITPGTPSMVLPRINRSAPASHSCTGCDAPPEKYGHPVLQPDLFGDLMEPFSFPISTSWPMGIP